MSDRQRPLLNEALLVARKYWGYTQVELAELMGVSQAMVSDIERGSKAVSMDMLQRYSNALGIRQSQLLFFAEEIEGGEPVGKGRVLIAERALSVLKLMKPLDKEDA